MWCDPDLLSYDWTYIYDDQASTDYNTLVINDTLLNYTTGLNLNQTVEFGYSHHEADYKISNEFTVSYAPTDPTQDPVSESATSAFSHEQTCRPKFAQSPDITDFTVSNDLAIQFSLGFNTTGY